MGDLRLTDEEQAERLIRGEAGQMRLETVQELDPPTGTAGRDNRDAGLAEGFDVAENGTLGDLKRFRHVSGGDPTAALQEQQHVQHPGGAHRASLGGI